MPLLLESIAINIAKRIINITIGFVLVMYLIVVVMLHVPMVQHSLGTYVSQVLEDKIGTHVSVGRIDLGFFNRLIIDDVHLTDQAGAPLLDAKRLSVKVSPYELTRGNIIISSIQIFGMKANIYKTEKDGPYNFQYIINAFSSKDKKESSPLYLQANSIILRNTSISFRQQKARLAQKGKFTPRDIELSHISSHIILNTLTNDSLSIKVKRMAFNEQSGFAVKKLSFRLNIGRRAALLDDFNLLVGNSQLNIPHISATYAMHDGKYVVTTLCGRGNIQAQSIIPSDFSCFLPQLSSLHTRFSINTNFTAQEGAIRIGQFTLWSSDNNLLLQANGSVNNISGKPNWQATLSRLSLSTDFIHQACEIANKPYPSFLNKDAKLHFVINGTAASYDNSLNVTGKLHSEIGNISVTVHKQSRNTSLSIQTKQFNLKDFTGNDDLGNIATNIHISGDIPKYFVVKGNIDNIAYKSKTYNNIHIDASYSKAHAKGTVSIDDPIGNIILTGQLLNTGKQHTLNIETSIKNLQTASLGILTNTPDLRTSMHLKANLTNTNLHGTGLLDNTIGDINITDIALATADTLYHPQDITLTSTGIGASRQISLRSGFCNFDLAGKFNYSSLYKSITNIVAKHIQTLPGTTLRYDKDRNVNSFTVDATVNDTHLLKKLTGIDLKIKQPLTLQGMINDKNDFIDLNMSIPSFTYNNAPYKNVNFSIQSIADSLCANASIQKIMGNGSTSTYRLRAKAFENSLTTLLNLNEDERHPIRGYIHARTNFYKNAEGISAAHVQINPSTLCIGDTIWSIHSSSIDYSKNDLTVNKFSISHDKQHLTIDGRATDKDADSLQVFLKDININYILNLVNFHSVEFSGMASGRACVSACFTKQPIANAHLTVNDFRFENGRMGTLYADASLNNTLKQIDINATAVDTDDRRTLINGYVSPQRSDIKLDITAQRTRVEFLESFCSSFMRDINGEATGSVCLAGPLSNINLTGELVADGSLTISSLNTTYTLKHDVVKFIPDAILFEGDTITDRNGNIGIVTGHLGHQHLTRLTYDLNVEAQHLLAYDTHTFDGGTFYGTAYVTGNCKIEGRSGLLDITVDGTPEKGSILVYNVASPDAITSHDFLSWTSQASGNNNDTDSLRFSPTPTSSKPLDVSTDIRINFLINCTSDATVKLLMDNHSGDYITLNGNGVLKANYYNKGSFDLFGNYNITNGHYKLTVQNFIKRDFLFRQGSSISFGGDPYAAALNLNAIYTLNSVSLSDLNIGKSFTSNNTRVDCLMNITGTPAAPHVDFSLDVPNLSTDARQMIYSVVNSEEEMNQQVLYLLAVGRFMSQGNNNSSLESNGQQSQASLAMQSILSGTISQQVNDVIGNLTNNSDWNFGANISTGTEGFNNAEYEGMLSGRLFSGRLLVDGQFGYRDNANATTSFIGDFDLKYLLYPNGNLAFNFYNKTNDRYFTRNSLTTQGIGLLMKKDFSSLSDLFGRKKKAKSPKKDKQPEKAKANMRRNRK